MSQNFELSEIEMPLSEAELLYEIHCKQVRRGVYKRVITWLHKNDHKLSECIPRKKNCPPTVIHAVRIAWNRGWLKGMPIKQCEVDLLGFRQGSPQTTSVVEVERTIPKPCEALQGTQAKVDEIERRYWAGEELWHDRDGDLVTLHG